MKKLLLVSLCFLLLCVTQTFAQNRTITGTVTAKEDGLPVPGVSVTVTGTQIGTQTNADGKYTISVPASAKSLSFSFIGYGVVTMPVDASGVVNASLSSDTRELTEVVVTALGIQRQKRELGYATTTVSATEVNKAKPVNIANGLQGKVSGLNITTQNSGVFEDVRINLRGIRSLLGSNSPLLLLDGVQVPLSYFSALNPNDIESVNILKGANSAAIYGPDAVNGVIVITTKKGSGVKPEITLSNSTQFSSISFFPKFQTQFGSGGYGAYTPYENWSWGDAFDGSDRVVGKTEAGTEPQILKYSPNNSREEFFNTATTVQNDISLKTADTYLSIQDAIINGIVPSDKNRRTGIRLNTAQEYGRLKANVGVNYNQQNYNVFDDDAMSDYNAANNVGLNGGLMNLIFNTPAQIPLTSYKDYKNNPYAMYNNYFNDYGLNPYFAIDNWRKFGKRENLIANIDLNLKATDWLNFTYRAAISSINLNEKSNSTGIQPSPFGITRGFTSIPQTTEDRAYRSNQLSSEFFASFNKTFADDYKVTAIAGTYLRQIETRDTYIGSNSLVVPGIFNLSQRTGELLGSSDPGKSRLLSFYGSVGLSYKGWANLEVTGRNDKTSLLNPEKNSYFYPGVSGSLVLTDAIEALKNNDFLSYVKVRGGWSKSGNANVGTYALRATYSQINGFPYTSVPGYTADDRYPDFNLKPEFIKSTEAGIELGFLKDKITFEATYYNQDNTNQIIPVQVSGATGYTSYLINAASFANRGVEMDLGLNRIITFKDGSVSFKANATYMDSEIKEVYSTLNELAIGGFTYASNYAIKGYPAFVFKATDYLRDDQGRVIVNPETGRPSADPNTKIFGQTMPKWIVGLNPTVTWKNLNLSVLFEYKGGHYVYHDIGQAMAWTGVSAATAVNNRESYVLPNSSYEDPAHPGTYLPNTSYTISNLNDFYTGEFRDVATNFLTKADSWRLREISLSYDVPVKIFGNQSFVKGLSVAVTGRNLFLWVPKTNVYGDPDFSFGTTTGSNLGVSSSNISGVADSQINPPVRTIGGNIVLKF
ncbi:SusC/RagA family TonB-linked outer membrane protein [Mucilaginibacter limnophilus]|uniref:SusC/RagA family TonB-linked outer membrane protein n=1 Tax=Mucilaginibacter limnophilus TaxID=1932778 RepID=A0A437MUM8_9SPHI|nr:SusC/RagA family TonB-linked outer membrane protein [Mucilaginibacter limnophilus]RVU01379.1 SusC/RagA family TonB-linked outer membrane protein [Mucilaginibacter limnophilus]